MARKTWIKLKRGILDPKHRRRLGQAWYLFFYMLDLVDWDTGVIYDWKDGDVASDLDIPVATLRDHRRKLEDNLYISTRIKQYGLEITVNKWTNPREYSGQVYNEVAKNTLPQENEVDTQVNTQVDTQVAGKLTPLHIIHSNHSITEADVIPLPKSPKAALKHPDIITFQEVCDRIPGMLDYALIIETIQYFRSLVPDEKKLIATLKPYWLAWKGRKTANGEPYKRDNYAWLTEWAMNGEIPEGRASPKGKTFADMAKEMEKETK